MQIQEGHTSRNQEGPLGLGFSTSPTFWKGLRNNCYLLSHIHVSKFTYNYTYLSLHIITLNNYNIYIYILYTYHIYNYIYAYRILCPSMSMVVNVYTMYTSYMPHVPSGIHILGSQPLGASKPWTAAHDIATKRLERWMEGAGIMHLLFAPNTAKGTRTYRRTANSDCWC